MKRALMAAGLGCLAVAVAMILNADHTVRHQLGYLYLLVGVFSAAYAWEKMR